MARASKWLAQTIFVVAVVIGSQAPAAAWGTIADTLPGSVPTAYCEAGEPGYYRCTNCHYSTCGGGGNCGGGLRPLGQAHCNIYGDRRYWNEAYAVDSDMDGFTNGEELLDPEGDGSYFAGTVSNPSDANSVPNECQHTYFHNCRANAECEDRSGKGLYYCRCPWPLDGDGREDGVGCLNPGLCQGDNLCGEIGTCIPENESTGTYGCSCPTGYEVLRYTDWQGRARASCQDINGCDLNPCGIGGSRCNNLTVGYSCECRAGYTFDGTSCVEVDVCLSDPCGEGVASCTMTAPNVFACSCRSGFALVGGVCEPEPCSVEPCGPFGVCTEGEAGSYSCACDEGFVEHLGTCNDRDECADIEAHCGPNATCENGFGTVTCGCEEGFSLRDGSCRDIDECARGTDLCHSDARCDNTQGGYTCDCDEGFRGSGLVCVDVDECSESLHRCGERTICENTRGGYACSCPAGLSAIDDPPEGVTLACAVLCGDGRVGPEEACDDGNDASDDGCDACAIEMGWACSALANEASECRQTCGDGFIDPLEECDEGARNSDSEPDACRQTCVWWSCGDGVRDSDEACDPARSSSCDVYCGNGPPEDGGTRDDAGSNTGLADAGDGDGGVGDGDASARDGGERDGGAAGDGESGGCRAAPSGHAQPALWAMLALLVIARRRRG